eukprot:m.71937 g.71937  ORF g.71937 m.71937 type:complete len:56 (-) comp14222_c0_seq1:170-337(-)
MTDSKRDAAEQVAERLADFFQRNPDAAGAEAWLCLGWSGVDEGRQGLRHMAGPAP